MKFGCYVILGLFLILFRTTVVPYFWIINQFYDVMIPFIFFLANTSHLLEGLMAIMILGFITDNLSESLLGLYITTYLWLFLGMRQIGRVMNVDNIIIASLVITSGVVIENLIGFTVAGEKNLSDILEGIGVQMLLALATGYWVQKLLGCGCKQWEAWYVRMRLAKNNLNE